MPKYIDAEPIKRLIVNGLNSKAFGNDAVKILTDIEYTPAADVVPTSIFTHAFVRLGLNQVYPIEHLDFACNQVTVLESTNVHNTVGLKNVVLMTGDPVVHSCLVGRWSGEYNNFGYCLECNAENLGHAKFCCQCGAKMDKEAPYAD